MREFHAILAAGSKRKEPEPAYPPEWLPEVQAAKREAARTPAAKPEARRSRTEATNESEPAYPPEWLTPRERAITAGEVKDERIIIEPV